MINWIYLIIGVAGAFIFAIYSIFWIVKLCDESKSKWFIIYVLIPTALLFGSIILMYFGIRGLL